MTSCRFFTLVAVVSQIYFRFSGFTSLTFKKVKNYLHTKVRQDISIRGWDITTSDFWKQTAAIIKFYFRFPLWGCHRHQCVILRRLTKFHPNRANCGRVMTSLRFSRWRPSAILDLLWGRGPPHELLLAALSWNFSLVGFIIPNVIFMLWRFRFRLPIPAHF